MDLKEKPKYKKTDIKSLINWELNSDPHYNRDPKKVSVIMTNYNCQNLIERSINSVLNQTHQNLELLIVDDNSTDSSLEIIKKIASKDERVRVFKNIKRLGTYWSKNSVIKKTTGSFITMIDSDDYDLPKKLEKQLSYFNDEEIVCVSCQNERKISEFSQQTEKIIFGYPSMMFRYQVFRDLGYYDTVKFGADSEFYDRVIKYYGKRKITHISEVLQISPRRTLGLTSIIPENSSPRKNYINNYQNWHKNTTNLYLDFPTKERPFVVSKESEVEYTDLSNSVILETKSTNILPVIMCVWKRIEGFENTILQLNEQKFRNFKLYVWNNNKNLKKEFEEILKKSNFEYELHHSEENIGGFGRFFYARKNRGKIGLMDHCVFIDDDQKFGPDLLSTFVSEIKSNRISSQWGWEFTKLEYYGKDSRRERNPGQSLHYAGTGGMVSDMRIFESDKLFECPEKYWFVEDLWLSFCANHFYGYELIKSYAKVKNGDDEHSLYKLVLDIKKPMLIDLISNYGWKILNYENRQRITEIEKKEEVTVESAIEKKLDHKISSNLELSKKKINYDKVNKIFSGVRSDSTNINPKPTQSNKPKTNSDVLLRMTKNLRKK